MRHAFPLALTLLSATATAAPPRPSPPPATISVWGVGTIPDALLAAQTSMRITVSAPQDSGLDYDLRPDLEAAIEAFFAAAKAGGVDPTTLTITNKETKQNDSNGVSAAGRPVITHGLAYATLAPTSTAPDAVRHLVATLSPIIENLHDEPTGRPNLRVHIYGFKDIAYAPTDEAKATTAALVDAAAQARLRATTLAKDLGGTLGPLRSVEQTSDHAVHATFEFKPKT